MDFFKKAIDSVTQKLPPEMQQKVKTATEKAEQLKHFAEENYEKYVTPEVKEKAKQLGQQALTGAKKLADVAEKQVYDKYVPEDIRNKVKSASDVALQKLHDAKNTISDFKSMGEEPKDDKSKDADKDQK